MEQFYIKSPRQIKVTNLFANVLDFFINIYDITINKDPHIDKTDIIKITHASQL